MNNEKFKKQIIDNLSRIFTDPRKAIESFPAVEYRYASWEAGTSPVVIASLPTGEIYAATVEAIVHAHDGVYAVSDDVYNAENRTHPHAEYLSRVLDPKILYRSQSGMSGRVRFTIPSLMTVWVVPTVYPAWKGARAISSEVSMTNTLSPDFRTELWTINVYFPVFRHHDLDRQRAVVVTAIRLSDEPAHEHEGAPFGFVVEERVVLLAVDEVFNDGQNWRRVIAKAVEDPEEFGLSRHSGWVPPQQAGVRSELWVSEAAARDVITPAAWPFSPSRLFFNEVIYEDTLQLCPEFGILSELGMHGTFKTDKDGTKAVPADARLFGCEFGYGWEEEELHLDELRRDLRRNYEAGIPVELSSVGATLYPFPGVVIDDPEGLWWTITVDRRLVVGNTSRAWSVLVYLFDDSPDPTGWVEEILAKMEFLG